MDLLGRDPEAEEVRQARVRIVEDPAVRRLLARRNREGYWGAPRDIHAWWPRKDTTFWVLGVLADFGLRREDADLGRACDYVFRARLPGGAFGVEPPPKPYDCYTGILARSLSLLGYAGDDRLEHAYQWLVTRQRGDGGFWCKDTGQPGGPREHEPSCAFASLCTLASLSVHPTLGGGEHAGRCAAFLLACWDNRGKVRYAGHDSEIATDWTKPKYPFTDYRILSYLDTLSRLPGVRGDPRLLEMAEVLWSRCDAEGRCTPQSIHKAWSEFDFGQKRKPSRWLTLLVHRIRLRLARM